MSARYLADDIDPSANDNADDAQRSANDFADDTQHDSLENFVSFLDMTCFSCVLISIFPSVFRNTLAQ